MKSIPQAGSGLVQKFADVFSLFSPGAREKESAYSSPLVWEQGAGGRRRAVSRVGQEGTGSWAHKRWRGHEGEGHWEAGSRNRPKGASSLGSGIGRVQEGVGSGSRKGQKGVGPLGLGSRRVQEGAWSEWQEEAGPLGSGTRSEQEVTERWESGSRREQEQAGIWESERTQEHEGDGIWEAERKREQEVVGGRQEGSTGKQKGEGGGRGLQRTGYNGAEIKKDAKTSSISQIGLESLGSLPENPPIQIMGKPLMLKNKGQ